jgi:hypothetical protein
LDGQVKFRKAKNTALPLLATDEGEIFVVTRDDGPRVAVFGGDTTYVAWYGNDDAVRAFERFWTQLVAWLARQEEGNEQVWVKLDKQRLAVGANQKMGFSVGANGKDGQPIRNGRYTVKVLGPGGEIYNVNTVLKLGEERGAFGQASAVGEYKVKVTGTMPGPQGQEISLGEASARFMGSPRMSRTSSRRPIIRSLSSWRLRVAAAFASPARKNYFNTCRSYAIAARLQGG